MLTSSNNYDMLLVDEREAAFLLSNWAQSKVEKLSCFSLIPEMCPFLLEQDMRICKVEGCNGKHKAKGLCYKHYRRQYYKQYQKDNKEHLKEYNKQHYLNNKEHCNKLHKQWNEANKEKISEYDKQWKQKYRLDNKEKVIKYYKQYAKTPAGKASRKANAHNHRLLTKGLTIKTIQRVYEDNRRKYGVLTCYLCLKPIVFGDKRLKDSLDHSTPVTRQGTNEYNNLGVAHLSCNSKKGTKTLKEWFKKNRR